MISPSLFIGQQTFKEISDLGYQMVDISQPNIEQFLQELIIASTKGVLLTDIAARPVLVKTVLLKFLEEYKGSIIIYSSKDVFTDTILSRFRFIKKRILFKEDEEYLLVKSKSFLIKSFLNKSKVSHRVINIWKAG